MWMFLSDSGDVPFGLWGCSLRTMGMFPSDCGAVPFGLGDVLFELSRCSLRASMFPSHYRSSLRTIDHPH
ncbi:unnamed protein product [Meloidogyne enterolobii]|uniref:Uncharacterized protein n=1 Tax=Meloidogyne enterolobii TaxID=390850 RepID=A0ACB1AVY6_MELEN